MAEEVKINIKKETISDTLESETIYLYNSSGIAAKYWKENIEPKLLKEGFYKTTVINTNIRKLAKKLGFNIEFNVYNGIYKIS